MYSCQYLNRCRSIKMASNKFTCGLSLRTITILIAGIGIIIYIIASFLIGIRQLIEIIEQLNEQNENFLFESYWNAEILLAGKCAYWF